VNHPLPLADQTLPRLLERQAEELGDAPLLRYGPLERSYAQMRDAIAATAGQLAAAGIAPGDRVAIMCENRIEVLDLVFGCMWLGAVAVPLNTALRGRQLEHQLVNSGARALAMDSLLVEVLEHVPAPETLEQVWALDGVPETVPAGYPVSGPPPTGAPLPPPDPAVVGPGTTGTILYTSGTTGLSKGVMCPQAQSYWWGVLVGQTLGVQRGDVLYTCLPLFHTNALNAFCQALVAGATFHVGPRFSASRFWDHVREAGATVTYILGAMVNILMSRPPGEGDRAHAVTRALAPATPAPLFDAFRERFGVQLVEAYGSTETNCAISAPWNAQRPGWMGRAVEGFDVRVVDADDSEQPPGVPGELVLRHHAPYAFATGYFGMPEKTVEAWRNLWFHTGDRVVADADGWIRFVDRMKDAIRRRGENVSSFEVEQALLEHPAVAAAAVFAVPADIGDDEVTAAIVVRDGHSLDPEELIRHCEPRLAYFAIPRYIRVVDALPLTENGKVRKTVLREQAVTPDTWDREAAGVTITRLGR